MSFGSLWLAVVASAVAVWILSAVLHMVLKYHRADYKPLADEAAVGDALRKAAPAPGLYMMPYCTDGSQMKDPAVIKKFEDGPIAMVTVMRNGRPAMGKNLLQWLLYCFLASFVAAYVARHTLHPGDDGLLVMRITGAVAFAAYAFGNLQSSIWAGVPWSNAVRGLIDSVVYSVATGFVFRWLWPAA